MDQIGRYQVVQEIASGGMGSVYLARQEGPAGFTKTLVVKRILPHLASDSELIEMFLNEARIAAVLQHQNIVQIFELGQDRDSYFIAMEYVHGRSLAELDRKAQAQGERVPLEVTARVVSQALLGLHHAHQHVDDLGNANPIVHRDVSPDNILVGFDGSVKLLDFGVAKATAFASKTRPGMLRGKLAYMPPEQVLEKPLDGRADVYAAGVVLYRMASGKRPYDVTSDAALIAIKMSAQPPPLLSQAVPGIDPRFEAIVAKAMAAEPENRFASAEEMAWALEELVNQGSKPAGAFQISSYMKVLFGDEARRPPSGSVSLLTPASRSGAKTRASSGSQSRTPNTPLPEEESVRLELERPTSKRWIGPILFLAIALGAGGIWLLSQQTRKQSRVVVTAVPSPSWVAEKPAPAAPSPQPVTAENPTPPEVPPEPVPPARPKPRPPAPVRKGRVLLMVHPWAEVFWNKRSLGVTPLAPFELPAGAQTLVLKNPSLDAETRTVVQVVANEQVTVKVNLRPRP